MNCRDESAELLVGVHLQDLPSDHINENLLLYYF